MDINLPDISGLEATKRIKEDPEMQKVPIVAFTADTNDADRQMYISAGCDGYLPKPASAQKLLTTVKEYIPS
jgi:two-component system cell cycle response regulator DivK